MQLPSNSKHHHHQMRLRQPVNPSSKLTDRNSRGNFIINCPAYTHSYTHSYNHVNLELLPAGMLRLSCFDMKSTSAKKPLRLGFLPASPAREQIIKFSYIVYSQNHVMYDHDCVQETTTGFTVAVKWPKIDKR